MFIVFLLYITIPFLLEQFGMDAIPSMMIVDVGIYLLVLYHRIKHPINRCVKDWKYLLIMAPLFIFTAYCWSKWYMVHIADTMSLQYSQILQSYNMVLYIIMIAIIAPLGEESLFRYVMINGISKKLEGRMILTILLSSGIFALVHGTGVHLLVGFICGVLFGTVYVMTNKLSASIVLHSVYNIGTLFVYVPDSFHLCIVFSIISIAFFIIMMYNNSCK